MVTDHNPRQLSVNQASQANHATPQHIAIIMDGNGRWAAAKDLPRSAGHAAGLDAVKATLSACSKHHIPYLTLFAFGRENWRRPQTELDHLFTLFLDALHAETPLLHEHNIRLRIIGERTQFSTELQQSIAKAEAITCNNTQLQLTLAVNYSGRWDITQAVQRLATELINKTIASTAIDEALLSNYLSLANLPDPDLLIRTSGEQRLSNFMLWQLAYTEFYFSPLLWPEFDEAEFAKALRFYATRERRFGGIKTRD